MGVSSSLKPPGGPQGPLTVPWATSGVPFGTPWGPTLIHLGAFPFSAGNCLGAPPDLRVPHFRNGGGSDPHKGGDLTNKKFKSSEGVFAQRGQLPEGTPELIGSPYSNPGGSNPHKGGESTNKGSQYCSRDIRRESPNLWDTLTGPGTPQRPNPAASAIFSKVRFSTAGD